MEKNPAVPQITQLIGFGIRMWIYVCMYVSQLMFLEFSFTFRYTLFLYTNENKQCHIRIFLDSLLSTYHCGTCIPKHTIIICGYEKQYITKVSFSSCCLFVESWIIKIFNVSEINGFNFIYFFFCFLLHFLFFFILISLGDMYTHTQILQFYLHHDYCGKFVIELEVRLNMMT